MNSDFMTIRANEMPNEPLSRADHCWQWVDDCVAMAKAATSNKNPTELYAAAEYYLHLAEVEGNQTARKSEVGHVPNI
jgi:hypothetical protein